MGNSIPRKYREDIPDGTWVKIRGNNHSPHLQQGTLALIEYGKDNKIRLNCGFCTGVVKNPRRLLEIVEACEAPQDTLQPETDVPYGARLRHLNGTFCYV